MHYMSIVRSLIKKWEDDFPLKLKYMTCQSDYERSKTFYESALCDQVTLPPCNDVLSYKSDQQAETFRMEGNQFFKMDKWIEAVEAYTKSLCYAVDDANVALSFSNRSAALNKLNSKDCLEDIERAIKYGYPENRRYKLEERKATFFSKINEKELAKQYFEEAIKYVKKSDLSKDRINSLISEYKLQLSSSSSQCSSIAPVSTSLESVLKYEKELPELKERHAVFTSLSRNCEVVYSEKGRHVVASRRFKLGEVIMIEKPYAKLINYLMMWNHCSHCLRHCLNGLPCNKCPFVIFCSQNCQQEGLQDHKIDCQLSKYLLLSNLEKYHILAVKAVTKVPAVEILKCTREKVVEEFDDERNMVLSSGRYEWNDYNTICDFVKHNLEITGTELQIKCFEALYLLKVLETTTYFEQVTSEAMHQTKVLVLSFLLNHLQSFPCKAYGIQEFAINLSSFGKSVMQKIGGGFYSTLSLFSHSCTPNTYRDNCQNVMVMRTTTPIEEGEEIFSNYGPLYLVMPKNERIKVLENKKFKCVCEACINDWPTIYSLSRELRYMCLQCHLPMQSIPRCRLKCGRCKVVENKHVRINEYEMKHKQFLVYSKLLEEFKPSLVLPRVIEYLEYLHLNFQQPMQQFEFAVILLQNVYFLMSNCYLMHQ